MDFRKDSNYNVNGGSLLQDITWTLLYQIMTISNYISQSLLLNKLVIINYLNRVTRLVVNLNNKIGCASVSFVTGTTTKT